MTTISEVEVRFHNKTIVVKDGDIRPVFREIARLALENVFKDAIANCDSGSIQIDVFEEDKLEAEFDKYIETILTNGKLNEMVLQHHIVDHIKCIHDRVSYSRWEDVTVVNCARWIYNELYWVYVEEYEDLATELILRLQES